MISLIASLKKQSTPENQQADPKNQLECFVEAMLNDCTVETLRGLARLIHCKCQATKTETSKAIRERTLELFDQLTLWKQAMEFQQEEVLQTIAYEVFSISEFHPGQLDVIRKVCSHQDSVCLVFGCDFIAFHCPDRKWQVSHLSTPHSSA